jgi:rhodanese-related sulfurtransferase
MNPLSPPVIRRDLCVLLLIALVPALLAAWLHPHRPAWTWTKPAVPAVRLHTLSSSGAPVLWVDARSASAFAQGHVPGAVLLNEDEWERLLPGLLAVWQPEHRIVVYCDASECAASQEIALRLKKELQIGNIVVLQGGWAAWQKERLR